MDYLGNTGVRLLLEMEKEEEDWPCLSREFFISEKGKDLGHTVIYIKH